MRTLGPYEIVLLAEAIDARYRALILTAAGTGLRFGELAGLRPSRIDMVNHTQTVAQALKEVRGQVVEGTPKKAAARRTIPLPRLVVDALDSHFSAGLAPSGDIFCAANGGPLRRSNFRRRFWLQAVEASVGMPLRFHDLRHSHAALLIAEGVHPKIIQERLVILRSE